MGGPPEVCLWLYLRRRSFLRVVFPASGRPPKGMPWDRFRLPQWSFYGSGGVPTQLRLKSGSIALRRTFTPAVQDLQNYLVLFKIRVGRNGKRWVGCIKFFNPWIDWYIFLALRKDCLYIYQSILIPLYGTLCFEMQEILLACCMVCYYILLTCRIVE